MPESEPLPVFNQESSAGEISDCWLLQQCRNGSEDAARQLYLRYAERLQCLAETKSSANLARRIDAEDIVQSVFRTFFRRVFQGGYDVPAGKDLWKLFQVIALNKIRAGGIFHRAAKRDVGLTIPLDGPGPAAEAHLAQHGDDGVLQIVIDETLDHLTPLQREMVQLRMEGYEIAEIADRLGRSRRTVERNFQEIRRRLRCLLPQE